MSKRVREDPSDPIDFEIMSKKFKELERVFLHAQRRYEREVEKQPREPPGNASSSSSSSAGSSRASSRGSSRDSSRAASPTHSSSSGSESRSPSRSRSASPAPRSKKADTSHHRQELSKDKEWPTNTTEPPPAPASGATASGATASPDESGQAGYAPPAPPRSSEEAPAAAPELDEELLKILGEDPSKTKATGKDIQTDLAVRLQHVATTGLSKETRKELLDKYLPPGNCALIDAPDLNPEVKAAVSDAVYKRDKGIKARQKQLASAIACVSEALTILLSSEQKDMTLIKILMDASKLLCDSQNQDSNTRRNFVLFNLKKELKDQLQEAKIDKYLFSKDLADTLKAAKAISKSGADMKPPNSNQQAKKTYKQPQKNLNWRAPPSTQRQKGTPRKEPARKSRPDNYSRASSRPAPPPPPPASASRSRSRR